MRVSYAYTTHHLAHDSYTLDTHSGEVEFSLAISDYIFPQQQMPASAAKQKEACTQQLHF